MTIDAGYKHSEVTDVIIGVFYEVYSELGFGFLESVYQKAMNMALLEKDLRVEAEVATSVFFRGQKVGDFRADLLVNQIVLLELKTAERIARAHEAEVLNYLRSTTLELALILNFGPQPQVRRLLLDNSRKQVRGMGCRKIARLSVKSVSSV